MPTPHPRLPRIRLNTPEEVLRELRSDYRATKGGVLDPSVATKLAFMLSLMLRGHETTETERRLRELEARAQQELA